MMALMSPSCADRLAVVAPSMAPNATGEGISIGSWSMSMISFTRPVPLVMRWEPSPSAKTGVLCVLIYLVICFAQKQDGKTKRASVRLHIYESLQGVWHHPKIM